MKTTFEQIGKDLQQAIEKVVFNKPTGICYLTGHCMAEALKRLGYNAREVSGELIVKGVGSKPIVYGDIRPKGLNVGFYHTWCEVEYGNETYIVDPSIKYNRKSHCENINTRAVTKTKIHPKIPNVLVTNSKKSFMYQYIEDSRFTSLSQERLTSVSPEMLNSIYSELQTINTN